MQQQEGKWEWETGCLSKDVLDLDTSACEEGEEGSVLCLAQLAVMSAPFIVRRACVRSSSQHVNSDVKW